MRAFSWANLPFASALVLVALSAPAHADGTQADLAPSDKTEASSADIDTALVPVVSFKGEEGSRLTLTQRREELGAQAASVAVMLGGEIAWTRAYGEGVDEDTLFQLASLSKTVASTGIIALSMELGVALDEDISGSLTGLDLARLNPDGLPITLRALLSHTNGTTVSGFPGYLMSDDVPTAIEVIEGTGPTNTKPVIIKPNPEGERRYSGGGYTLAQHWAEVASGEAFPALMRRLVLDRVGMERSTFASGTAETFARDNVARGFQYSGEVIPGGWRIHPEQAAASLWSTPREYLRFVRALLKAMDGDGSAGIDPAVAQAMTQPIASEYGLGIGVAEINGAIRLSHSGSNRGYKSNFMAYPATGDAVISVVNSDRGFALVGDIGRTANIVYGWPIRARLERTRMAASPEDAAALVGDYSEQGESKTAFTLTSELPVLVGTSPSGYRFELVKTGEMTFIDPQDGQEGTFVTNEAGEVSVTFGGTTYVKAAAP
ncbi:MAG: serine hydrolase domain-containing protein [Pseudomonadota bacterium]